jgi:hypothetical protein
MLDLTAALQRRLGDVRDSADAALQALARIGPGDLTALAGARLLLRVEDLADGMEEVEHQLHRAAPQRLCEEGPAAVQAR